MPVECSIPLKRKDQDAFHAIDKVVMRHAFDIHNEMGRFCDESIYHAELSQRCMDAGLLFDTEVMVRVSHDTFFKDYFLDALLDRGGVYEFKTVKTLCGSNKNQLINYLLLTGLLHGKLINFRPKSVESRFVSTTLNAEVRKHFSLDLDHFDKQNDSAGLPEILMELLNDWGAFPDLLLYRDALSHFLCDGEICSVDVIVKNRVVGEQKMCLLSNDTALHVSAINRHFKSYETHIARLLQHTPLKCIQWVNFNQRDIAIRSVKNDSAVNDSVKIRKMNER